ncbi:hypothetical protein [Methylocapsa sp. S129]|uniref:hypothetical protein n=1 Tax=Methylocapsa sp. S129 TaxID=1641869 RepID=UPI00131D390E|nr:hypothetical protein [Methylocapsa sp. S129]
MSEDFTYLRFDAASRKALELQGLSWTAIESIFLCPTPVVEPPRFLPGCPKMGSWYQTREYLASQHTILSIHNRVFALRDPWTNANVEASSASALEPQEGRAYGFIPLVYAFGQDERSFWAASCDLTGRIVYLFVPALRLVIYEMSLKRAQLIHSGLCEALARLDREREEGAREKSRRVIGLLDMVTNFGHHMINHLAGLDLLIDHGLAGRLDEVWIVGSEFFGNVEELYPEIGDRVRRFSSRRELSAAVRETNDLVVRIGANFFFETTRQRILKAANGRYASNPSAGRRPLIAVTIRGAGRRCENLAEVITHIYENLRADFPQIGFVIDGWVFREQEIVSASSAATCLDARYASGIKAEFAAAREAFKNVPAAAIARNLLGASILSSIVGLSDIDAYLAHVGTLQHKIAFFSLARGVVHGPVSQMTDIEAGPFQAALGVGPLYVEPSMIEDIPTGSDRGPAFNNYRILDAAGVSRRIRMCLEASESSAPAREDTFRPGRQAWA